MLGSVRQWFFCLFCCDKQFLPLFPLLMYRRSYTPRSYRYSGYSRGTFYRGGQRARAAYVSTGSRQNRSVNRQRFTVSGTLPFRLQYSVTSIQNQNCPTGQSFGAGVIDIYEVLSKTDIVRIFASVYDQLRLEGCDISIMQGQTAIQSTTASAPVMYVLMDRNGNILTQDLQSMQSYESKTTYPLGNLDRPLKITRRLWSSDAQEAQTYLSTQQFVTAFNTIEFSQWRPCIAVGVAIPGVNVQFDMTFTYEIHYTVAFRGVRMDRSLLPITGGGNDNNVTVEDVIDVEVFTVRTRKSTQGAVSTRDYFSFQLVDVDVLNNVPTLSETGTFLTITPGGNSFAVVYSDVNLPTDLLQLPDNYYKFYPGTLRHVFISRAGEPLFLRTLQNYGYITTELKSYVVGYSNVKVENKVFRPYMYYRCYNNVTPGSLDFQSFVKDYIEVKDAIPPVAVQGSEVV